MSSKGFESEDYVQQACGVTEDRTGRGGAEASSTTKLRQRNEVESDHATLTLTLPHDMFSVQLSRRVVVERQLLTSTCNMQEP